MPTLHDIYKDLRQEIEPLPVVDCHEHHQLRGQIKDIIGFIASGYFEHDIISAVGEAEHRLIFDSERSLEERWPSFEQAYRAVRFTGYGRMNRYAMEHVFGSSEVTLSNLKAWSERIPDYSDPEQFESLMDAARVAARVTDNWAPIDKIVQGTYAPLPRQHLAISLPQFHNLSNLSSITRLCQAAGQSVTSLDEYLGMCRFIFEHWKERGAVCFKDQSAYERSLAYGMPTKSEAESVFNRLLTEPKSRVEWGRDAHALSDFLMHAFMRMAREMELPVQIHTGHMAGNYNDVSLANARYLRPLLEVHKEVRFDLFHANWPYDGDILFLVKNYPNVHLDFCWTHQVDPVYARNLMARAVMTIPHTKVFGVGSDVSGYQPHHTLGHVRLAKNVIAEALAELVFADHIDHEAALEIARGWLYENGRRFYRLPIKPLA